MIQFAQHCPHTNKKQYYEAMDILYDEVHWKIKSAPPAPDWLLYTFLFLLLNWVYCLDEPKVRQIKS